MEIKDCANCITYAICRSELITLISDTKGIQLKGQSATLHYNIISSYSFIVSSKCPIQHQTLLNEMSYVRHKATTTKTMDAVDMNVETLIVQAFNLNTKDYL